mmetsp:Transcript_30259/g.97708  ORF Transcript_30259/g.97708 Transcript_30259/m.97708 type:complete len:353 (-) Transcript_30259:1355-2413(-)
MALEIKSHESDDRGCRGQGLCARATKYLVHECMQHHAASCRLVLASCSKLQAPHSSDTGSAAAGAIHHQRRPHTATTNAIAHTAAVRPHPHGLGKASSWPSFVRAAEAQIALRHMTGPIASPFGATLQDSSIPLYPIVSVGCVGHDVWGAENVADAVPPRHIMHMPYGNTLGRASHARSRTVRYALPREANGSRAAVLPCPPAEVSARGDEIRASSPATDRRRVSRPLQSHRDRLLPTVYSTNFLSQTERRSRRPPAASAKSRKCPEPSPTVPGTFLCLDIPWTCSESFFVASPSSPPLLQTVTRSTMTRSTVTGTGVSRLTRAHTLCCIAIASDVLRGLTGHVFHLLTQLL